MPERPLPITAIMGTINEEANLKALLPRLRPVVREIVVVDDGSTDGSRRVAEQFGCRVVARPSRLGIGSAIYAGARVATQPFIVTMDADGSHPPESFDRAFARMEEGYDIVRFSRFLPGSTWPVPRRRRLVIGVYGALWNVACRFRFTDPTNGFLLAQRLHFEGRTRFADDPGEGWVAEFCARNRAARFAEVPYPHAERVHGTSRFGLRREAQRAIRSLSLGRAGGRR